MSTTHVGFRLTQPQLAGALAVYPILGGPALLEYRSFVQALKFGVSVSEVDAHGSVNELLIRNPTDQPVLLYEGELFKGARQNRTVDAPVLVPAGVELRIPVSCVERGRWDERRGHERLAPAAFARDPDLRAAARADANARSVAGAAARPAQAAVWGAVDATLADHGAQSPSSDLSYVYELKAPDLQALTRDIHAVEGQLGAVIEISGAPVALDLVSRAAVFADLLPRLAEGYALKALGSIETPTSEAAAQRFLQAVLAANRRWLPTPGMGDAFASHAAGLEGCGLTVAGELTALSAFPSYGSRLAAAA
jgi:hypothetical protein